MALFDHTFGVEIECYLPENTTRDQLAAAVSQRLGSPNACIAQTYNHDVSSAWKIVTDGSLSDYNRGVEIVSPVLRGAADLAKVEIVCKALNDFGVTVNRRCGLHVHVGVGQNASMRFWKDLVSIYSVFETVIDKMMPESRRASNNTYCRSMTTVSLQTVQTQTTLHGLIGAIGHGRYTKVNIGAYMRHHTVEFRQHSGTTDANKVRNWVIICLSMVDTAKKEQFNTNSFGGGPRNNARRGTKNHMIGEMIMRPQGVTSAEVLAVTGWKTVSITEIAGFCGIQITSQKRGRITRYFARSATINASPTTFATAIELPAETSAYVNSRITDLSGAVAWAA